MLDKSTGSREASKKLGAGNIVRDALEGKFAAHQQLARLAMGGDLRPVKLLMAHRDSYSSGQSANQALRLIFRALEPGAKELLCESCLARFETRKIKKNWLDRHFIIRC